MVGKRLFYVDDIMMLCPILIHPLVDDSIHIRLCFPRFPEELAADINGQNWKSLKKKLF